MHSMTSLRRKGTCTANFSFTSCSVPLSRLRAAVMDSLSANLPLMLRIAFNLTHQSSSYAYLVQKCSKTSQARALSANISPALERSREFQIWEGIFGIAKSKSTKNTQNQNTTGNTESRPISSVSNLGKENITDHPFFQRSIHMTISCDLPVRAAGHERSIPMGSLLKQSFSQLP